MTFLIIGIIVYEVLGLIIVGYILGASKLNNSWSPKQALDQFTSDRFIWFYWLGLSQIAVPGMITVCCMGLYQRITKTGAYARH